MITVAIRKDELSAQYIIGGHAGYAEKGYDIVCAGVSTATTMLAEIAEAWRDDGMRNLVSVDDDDGGAWHIYICSEGNPVVNTMLDCVTETYKQIAEQYPDHLTVRMID